MTWGVTRTSGENCQRIITAIPATIVQRAELRRQTVGHMTDGASYDLWLWSLDASDTVNADSGDTTSGDDTLDVATIDYVFNGSNW